MPGSRERERALCLCWLCGWNAQEKGRELRKQLTWAKLWKGESRESTHTATEWGAWLACRKRDRERVSKQTLCMCLLACYAGMAKRRESRESLKAAVFGLKVAEKKIGRSGWRNRGRALLSWFCLFSLPGAPPISQQNWFVYTKLVFLLKTAFSFHNKLVLFSQNSCFGAKNGWREDWQIRMEEQG